MPDIMLDPLTTTVLEDTPAEPPGAAPAVLTLSATVPESVLRIPVSVQVVIGSARLPLSRIAQLEPGAVIALDEKLGAPALILVNGREVARGELFVLDGEDGGDRLGITITGVVSASGNGPV